jgi:predicted glycosyltransferase
MRDITFGPEQTRSIWTNELVYPLLDEVYDRILVYGDQRVFDPMAAYEMSEPAAARTRFSGYLAPLPPRRSQKEVRRETGASELPLVVVSVGGGADGGAVLHAYLTGLRDRIGSPLASYVVGGPLLPESERQELTSLAAMSPNVYMVDFDPDFAAAVQAADVVVSMGGYNSVAEAVYFGKRPVIVPRLPGPEEQLLRAEGFARLGLARVVSPRNLSSDSLWSAIDQELRSQPPACQPLPFDGLHQIAGALSELLVD